jgi:hypothetical protein
MIRQIIVQVQEQKSIHTQASRPQWIYDLKVMLDVYGGTY